MSTRLDEIHGSVGSADGALEAPAERFLGRKTKVRFNFGDVEVSVDNTNNNLVPPPPTFATDPPNKADWDDGEERKYDENDQPIHDSPNHQSVHGYRHTDAPRKGTGFSPRSNTLNVDDEYTDVDITNSPQLTHPSDDPDLSLRGNATNSKVDVNPLAPADDDELRDDKIKPEPKKKLWVKMPEDRQLKRTGIELTGFAGGALAGAGIGFALGTVAGPVGMLVGGIVGGVIGLGIGVWRQHVKLGSPDVADKVGRAFEYLDHKGALSEAGIKRWNALSTQQIVDLVHVPSSLVPKEKDRQALREALILVAMRPPDDNVQARLDAATKLKISEEDVPDEAQRRWLQQAVVQAVKTNGVEAAEQLVDRLTSGDATSARLLRHFAMSLDEILDDNLTPARRQELLNNFIEIMLSPPPGKPKASNPYASVPSKRASPLAEAVEEFKDRTNPGSKIRRKVLRRDLRDWLKTQKTRFRFDPDVTMALNEAHAQRRQDHLKETEQQVAKLGGIEQNELARDTSGYLATSPVFVNGMQRLGGYPLDSTPIRAEIQRFQEKFAEVTQVQLPVRNLSHDDNNQLAVDKHLQHAQHVAALRGAAMMILLANQAHHLPLLSLNLKHDIKQLIDQTIQIAMDDGVGDMTFDELQEYINKVGNYKNLKEYDENYLENSIYQDREYDNKHVLKKSVYRPPASKPVIVSDDASVGNNAEEEELDERA